MEVRIAKMEKEIALMGQTQQQMSQSLKSIAHTLEKISEVQLDTKLLEERMQHLDRDLVESFQRVHKRVDELEKSRNLIIKIVVGGFISALVTFVIQGGIV